MNQTMLQGRLAIFRINYKSDFIITLNSDAGWMTPFCIKFWTGAPSQAYFAGWDGTTYTNCAPVAGEPTKLQVQFDDHHLPIGELKYQIGYHFTIADFPTTVEDEVLNQERVVINHDGQDEKVLLDFNGETAPDIQFSLPSYANEAQRIANEEERIANEQQRIYNEEQRIANEQTRQQNEAQRIAQETARVQEFARLKRESESATSDATAAATLANEKAQLAADKAALAQAAATLANAKAQLAADKAALAASAAQLANDKAALAQQKAEYAQTQGTYAKNQGDYAKQQGDYAKDQGDTALADHLRAEADHETAASDHTRAESDHSTASSDHTQASTDHSTATSDHSTAAADHTQAGNDHTRAESDHSTAASDHTTAGNDHTRAESDHTRAESDHAAVEVYVDSLGAYDISAAHAVGGVLATYANLQAALGTNGANIPEGIRKGGMSVKFVQENAHRSDNNYAQYMYMANNLSVSVFTNIDNWQRIDSKRDAPHICNDNYISSLIKELWISPSFNKGWSSIFIKLREINGVKVVYFSDDSAQTNYVQQTLSDNTFIYNVDGIIFCVDISKWPGTTRNVEAIQSVITNYFYAPTCYSYYYKGVLEGNIATKRDKLVISNNSHIQNFFDEILITSAFTKGWSTLVVQLKDNSAGHIVYFSSTSAQTDAFYVIVTDNKDIYESNGIIFKKSKTAWPGQTSKADCYINNLYDPENAPICSAYLLDKPIKTSTDTNTANITSLDERVSAIESQRDNKQNTLLFNNDINAESFVIAPFNSDKNIKIGFRTNRYDVIYRNACLNFSRVFLVDKTTSAETHIYGSENDGQNDDVAPSWFTNDAQQLGANHGIYGNVLVVCSSAHGKTAADIGSIWSNGTNNFTITGIENSTSLYLLGDNKRTYPEFAFYQPNSTDTFTHVSGATHTDSFTITSLQQSQLNSYRKPQIRVFADNTELSANGTYPFNELKVVEYYDVPNPASVLNVIKANVGTFTENIKMSLINGTDKMFRVTNTFTFKDGVWFVAVDLTMFQTVNFRQYGGIQHAIVAGDMVYVPKDSIYRIPQVAPTVATYITKANSEDANLLPDRIVTYNNTIGFSLGYLFDCGDGGAKRKNLIETNAMYLSPNPKLYPWITDKLIPAGQSVSIVGWRKWIDRNTINTNGILNVDVFEYNNKLYIYADYNQAGNYDIDIPIKYVGKDITVLEARSNVSLLTPVSGEKILVKVDSETVMYGYIVMQIEL